jgi:hypothetical protein
MEGSYDVLIVFFGIFIPKVITITRIVIISGGISGNISITGTVTVTRIISVARTIIKTRPIARTVSIAGFPVTRIIAYSASSAYISIHRIPPLVIYNIAYSIDF